MTPQEKKLLEIELATRSQYGVICAIKPVAAFHDLPFSGSHKIKNVCIREDDTIFHFGPYEVHGVENIRPYLRPLSSMTEEEYGQYMEFIEWSHNDYDGTTTTCINKERLHEYLEFIYSHHLDDNNFIEKGLALEAPEGMYEKF